MTEISAMELFCIVLSSILFFFVFSIITTNWNFKNSVKEDISEEIIFPEEESVSRPVILRMDERMEVLAGKMHVNETAFEKTKPDKEEETPVAISH